MFDWSRSPIFRSRSKLRDHFATRHVNSQHCRWKRSIVNQIGQILECCRVIKMYIMLLFPFCYFSRVKIVILFVVMHCVTFSYHLSSWHVIVVMTAFLYHSNVFVCAQPCHTFQISKRINRLHNLQMFDIKWSIANSSEICLSKVCINYPGFSLNIQCRRTADAVWPHSTVYLQYLVCVSSSRWCFFPWTSYRKS